MIYDINLLEMVNEVQIINEDGQLIMLRDIGMIIYETISNTKNIFTIESSTNIIELNFNNADFLLNKIDIISLDNKYILLQNGALYTFSNSQHTKIHLLCIYPSLPNGKKFFSKDNKYIFGYNTSTKQLE